MDSTSPNWAIICLASICLVGLGMAGLVALVLWLIRRWRRAVTHLRPWPPESLEDLSAKWEARWVKLPRRVRGQGMIHSVHDPKGPAWIAFTFNIRGGRETTRGTLEARTTEHTFSFDITPERTTIHIDGELWGTILPDGTLLDSTGEAVGSAPRVGGPPILFVAGAQAALREKLGRPHTVTLHGREIGRLASFQERRKWGHSPAVFPAGSLSEEESTWLLALTILLIAGHNLPEDAWMEEAQ
ncbi:MAG: hypothetical protein GXP39_00935 [Chloroflexi bacterium]|nr:hypothetical protein [Chloroflexota bacterium]